MRALWEEATLVGFEPTVRLQFFCCPLTHQARAPDRLRVLLLLARGPLARSVGGVVSMLRYDGVTKTDGMQLQSPSGSVQSSAAGNGTRFFRVTGGNT